MKWKLRQVQLQARRKLPPSGLKFSPHQSSTTRAFTIVSGQWREEGGELLQTNPSRVYSELMFGDDRWTDYDFSIDAMRVAGDDPFSLFFRSTGPEGEFEYTVAGDGNKTCYALARVQGNVSILKSYDLNLRDGAWYTAFVHVRGNHFACSLYDSHNGTETRVFDLVDDRHPRGRVGLRTFGSSFRFKNIKVTAPDGRELWEGLPAIEPAKLAESSKPADPPAPTVAREEFVQLFNGIDSTGWKTHPRQPGHWHVERGVLMGSGQATSHLYTVRDDYQDFHLRVEARVNNVGNSGICFRAAFGPRRPSNNPIWPNGYEAQINSGARDPNRTGSLYAGFEIPSSVMQSPIPGCTTWFVLTDVQMRVAVGRVRRWNSRPASLVCGDGCSASSAVGATAAGLGLVRQPECIAGLW